MQRVISLQTFRSAERGPEGGEYVTKRLCCSFLLSVAFLSVLGGFLLGRSATDRALKQRQRMEECNTFKLADDVYASIARVNNLTRHMSDEESHRVSTSFSYHTFYEKLKCSNFTPELSQYARDLDETFLLKSSRILSAHLDSLNQCFTNAGDYLETQTEA